MRKCKQVWHLGESTRLSDIRRGQEKEMDEKNAKSKQVDAEEKRKAPLEHQEPPTSPFAFFFFCELSASIQHGCDQPALPILAPPSSAVAAAVRLAAPFRLSSLPVPFRGSSSSCASSSSSSSSSSSINSSSSLG